VIDAWQFGQVVLTGFGPTATAKNSKFINRVGAQKRKFL
jgi:hypothetical protein